MAVAATTERLPYARKASDLLELDRSARIQGTTIAITTTDHLTPLRVDKTATHQRGVAEATMIAVAVDALVEISPLQLIEVALGQATKVAASQALKRLSALSV
jgi:hypothetical protein